MQAAARPYVLASAALMATGLVAATPLPARQLQPPIRSIETRLVDAGSVLNIPINLFDDIVNIPYNEVQALDTAAYSLLDTGPWFVPDATNVWGIGPWDITHVAAVDALLLPFPSLDQGLGGLNYQIDGLLAAEIPESASCDAATCAPIVPYDVVTGISAIDQDIGTFDALTGQDPQFGLFDHWFQVPLSELVSGYTFNAANDPGVVDPAGPVFQEFGFPLDGGTNPFEGGTTLVDGQNVYPWDGLTYTLNPLQPIENFYNSLLQTPSGGIGGTGIEIPTLTEFTQALQNVAAGVVIDFDPFTLGSPACPASCDIPQSLTIPAMVQDIANLDPSDTTLQTWLAEYAAGTAAWPTVSQSDETIALLQHGLFDLTPAQLATVDADLASINPELPALYTNAGILTDPGYLAYTEATASTTTGPTTTAVFDPVYGGANDNLVPQDLVTLLTNNDTNFSALSEPGVLLALLYPAAIVTDPGAFSAGAADPSSASTMLNDAANLSALLGLSGASSLSTDLSALLSQLSAELSTALSADLATTLPTDLATTLPTTLLSMF